MSDEDIVRPFVDLQMEREGRSKGGDERVTHLVTDTEAVALRERTWSQPLFPGPDGKLIGAMDALLDTRQALIEALERWVKADDDMLMRGPGDGRSREADAAGDALRTLLESLRTTGGENE